MTFEEYIIGKKIDAKAFKAKEPQVWAAWQAEFQQMHPKSFTAQKLYLINPIRRKYTLAEENVPKPAPVEKVNAPAPATTNDQDTPAPVKKPVAKVTRPVVKAKPKFK